MSAPHGSKLGARNKDLNLSPIPLERNGVEWCV